jgi:hypothetical protein
MTGQPACFAYHRSREALVIQTDLLRSVRTHQSIQSRCHGTRSFLKSYKILNSSKASYLELGEQSAVAGPGSEPGPDHCRQSAAECEGI